jgi:hypothetical protein
MSWRGPIRGNDLSVGTLDLGSSTLFRRPPSSFEFAKLFSRSPLPVGQMCQQSFAGHPRLAPKVFICASVSESIREINSSKTLSSSRATIDLSKIP